jgi:3',5'-cyclic AMP phosphodiesterase CpdA
MSDRAEEFLKEWETANIQPCAYPTREDAEEAAHSCLLAAEAAGIGRQELRSVVAQGDLTKHMSQALTKAMDEYVDDRVARDRS